jgi:amino acid adenylation domain-containing protein
MIIGILGILKAGAAFVPIDHEYPKDRIQYILEDTQAHFLLTQSHLKEVIGTQKGNAAHLILLDQFNYSRKNQANLKLKNNPQNLAYVIYTSGTSGKPKGVMNVHYGLVNRLEWMRREYKFDHTDKVLQKTPYVFDVSVWELLLPLISGATLVFIAPEAHKSPEAISNIIIKEKISRLHFVPSMLDVYLKYVSVNKYKNEYVSLKSVFCSGEALSLKISQEFFACYPEVELHNLYGPTEATIDVTHFSCTKENQKVYIGRPIDNTKLYVLDENLKPVPIGALGELYIGGAGVARGYLNRPDLTAERFIPSPFASEFDNEQDSLRLYKTGDLVRWVSGGNLEYFGRNDFQVKLRGFRIELGEIENILLNYPDMKQVVVILKDRGQSGYLIAYYVAEKKLDHTRLSNYLN